jgi:hypothetical protein
MPDKAGLCVPTNDIMVVWAENGEINYSIDGGETWEGWIPDFMNADNGPAISDLLVNENGDVYLGLTTLGGDGGLRSSPVTLKSPNTGCSRKSNTSTLGCRYSFFVIVVSSLLYLITTFLPLLM